jgi:hypothetical protein
VNGHGDKPVKRCRAMSLLQTIPMSHMLFFTYPLA